MEESIEMKEKRGNYRNSHILFILLSIIFIHSPVFAELRLESVEPAIGVLGQDLEVTLTGTGFDQNTRVSISVDVMSVIGSVDTPDSACGVAVSGNAAYVADSYSGLQVIDISDPRNPAIIGSVDTPDSACGVAVSGNAAYVVDSYSGLQVIDISDPRNPAIIGSVDMPGYAYGVAVSGTTAYVADSYSGLQVIDISDPRNPTIIGSVDTPNFARGVAVSGTTAYVADWDSGLQVIDISDPRNPTIIGSVDTPDYAWGVAVSGTTAYVANYNSGLQVIDISDPKNPAIIGSVDTPGYAYGIAISGTTAYVADYNSAYVADRFSGLQVIDISDPSNPAIIGFVDTPGSAYGVAISGATAYVADDNSGLRVIDISDPKNFAIIGSVDTPGNAYGVTVSGTTAYVADGGSGLQAIDISDPRNPAIVGSVDTLSAYGASPYGVAVSGDMAYVADGTNGLQIMPIPVEIKPVIVNSGTSMTLTLPSPQMPGNYTLRVFNSAESHELPGVIAFNESSLPTATITGVPDNPTNQTHAALTVGGSGVIRYRYRINGGIYSAEIPVETEINLTGLDNGTHSVDVLGGDSVGNWQTIPATATWTVDTLPPVPGASPAGGIFNAEQSIVISVNETADIYYTTDGSIPTTISKKYVSTITITITETTTLKFMAVDTAGNESPVYTENYITDQDSDGDGLTNNLENTICTDPFDADTDDDGIPDGAEDANHDGLVDSNETDPCNADTDGDGIQDGTELSYTSDDIVADTDTNLFRPDLDPLTSTDPLNPDTDGDGLPDGREDINCNGKVDDGETDPAIFDFVSDLKAEVLSDRSIKLNWTPSISGYAAEYNIYWDQGTGIMDYASPLASINHPASEYITFRIEDGIYHFVIRSEYESGIEEKNTHVVSAKIDTTPPEEVKNFRCELTTGNKVLLSWSPSVSPDVEYYNIYSDNGSGAIDYTSPVAILDSNTFSLTSDELASGSYMFAIVAVDSSGNSINTVTTVRQIALLYPDLSIAFVNWIPAEFKFGDVVRFTVQIANNGTVANEKGFFIGYYCDDIAIRVKYYKDPIPPGETIEIPCDWQANIVSRQYALTVTVDALEDRVVESDETNNSLTQDITILPEYIVALSTDHQAYVAGNMVRLSAMVANSTAPNSYYTDQDITVSYELKDENSAVLISSTQLSFDDSSGVNLFSGQIDTTGYPNGAYTFFVTAEGIGGAKTAACNIQVADDVSITAQTSTTVYYPGEPVIITGQVATIEGTAVDDLPVSITLEVRGFKRQFNVKTDAEGNYHHTFKPFQGEGGSFAVRAATTVAGLYRQAETDFIIEGLFITPTSVTVDMSKNTSVQGTVKIINIGTEEISGLDLSIKDPDETDSVTASITDTDLPGMLATGQKLSVNIKVAGGLDAPDQAIFELIATGDGIPEANVLIKVVLHEPAPLPVIEPGRFRIGLHPGELVTRKVSIRNGGYGFLHNLKVARPGLEWASIVGADIGDLEPSQTATFEVWIKPYQDTQLGIYQTEIVIESDEGRFYVNATIDVNAAETGRIDFKVRNDLGDNVSNAAVTLISEEEYTLETVSGTKSYKHIVSEKADENGMASFSNLPRGQYRFQADAAEHDTATGDIRVMPGNNNEPVTLDMVKNLVHVEWNVTPIEITDRYTIDLMLTFETDTPKPVLLLSPCWLEFSMREGEVVSGQLSVVNPSHVEIRNVVIDASGLEGVDLYFDSPEGPSKVINIDVLEPQEPPLFLPYKVCLKQGASRDTRNLGAIHGEGEYVYFTRYTLVPEPRTGKTNAHMPVKYLGYDPLRKLRVSPGVIHFTEYCEGIVSVPALDEITYRKATVFNEDKESVQLGNAIGFTTSITAMEIAKTMITMGAGLVIPTTGIGVPGISSIWAGFFEKDTLEPGEATELILAELSTTIIGLNLPDIGARVGLVAFGYKWETQDMPSLYTIPVFITSICNYGISIPVGFVSGGFGGGGSGMEWHGYWPGGSGSYDVPGWSKISLPKWPPGPTVHEVVKLKISQEAALEREAFNASMEITPLADDLEDVKVDLIIKDDEGNITNDLFQYTITSLSGIDSLDGNGIISPNNPGKIEWIVVPGETAGGISQDGRNYHVGAKLYFSVNGLSRVYETEYEPILVKPQPSLVIDYYIPAEVKANTPFKLNVKVRNDGPGTAHNFRIISAQPEIISNLSGLLVDFVIHGSGVLDIYTAGNMEPVFGDIMAGETIEGYWLMTSSLDGDFTSFQAVMKHENYLGMQLNPLIKEVNTHIDQWNADADNDGLEDAWEIKYWHSTGVVDDPYGDYDGDGLNNLDEWTNFADPAKVDTDGDGYSDNEEAEQGASPSDPDDYPEHECPYNAEDLARAFMPTLYQTQVDLDGNNEIIEIGYHIKQCDSTSTTIEYNIVFRDEDIGPMIDCGNYDDPYDQCRACNISPHNLLPWPLSQWLQNELYTGRVEDIETIQITGSIEQNADGSLTGDITHISFPGTWAGEDADNYYVIPPSHASAELSGSEINRIFTQEQGHLTVYVVTWNHEFFNKATNASEFVKTSDHTFSNLNPGTRDDLEDKYHSECIVCFLDQDGDKLTDSVDAAPRDIDGDDDGLTDGSEDLNANGIIDPGETDPANHDSDGDGIFDGTEQCLTEPETIEGGLGGTDLSAGHFIADADPSTKTDPTMADTDNDGLTDGKEDRNHNGMVDSGETDPLVPTGDVDNNGAVDLADAILALRIVNRITVDVAVCTGSDVSGDGKIGIEEAIYVLQVVSGTGRQALPLNSEK